jgi:holo-[acyl-carrier protein] synthase
MIAGVGIDMIEVERVAAKIGRNNGFRDLVFSPGEISYCEAKTNKYEHYAARFAAKEAFLKAAGTGWINELNLFEIEIVNDETGKPALNFSGVTAQAIELRRFTQISVSLSHLKSIASAIVIIETDQ